MEPLFALKQLTFVKLIKLMTGKGFTFTTLEAVKEHDKLGILIVTT